MKPNLRNEGPRRGRLAIVGLVGLVALVGLSLGPGRCSRAAWAQEQDLPGVVSDSIVTNGRTSPATPGVPAPPPGGGSSDRVQMDRRDIEELRSHIHAGDNDLVKVGEDIEVGTSDHVLGDVFAMGGNVTVRG